MSHKGFCDKCDRQTRVVRLDTGGHSGVFLCRSCWAREMAWRKQRNKTLTGKAKFSIRKYPG